MRMVLHVTTGSERGKQVMLRRGELSVGRSYLADLPCPQDGCMSDVHLKIHREGKRYFLSDLDSTNGCSINGFTITGPTALNHGDTISAGKTELHVQIQDDRASARETVCTTELRDTKPSPSTDVWPRRRGATYVAQPCETGLVAYRGRCDLLPPHMLAAMLADTYPSYFIVDRARTLSPNANGERGESLFDWLPDESRENISPEILAAANVDQAKLFERGWGRDGMILLCCDRETKEPVLLRQLHELAGMFVRPSVLVPQLQATAPSVIESVFVEVTAILVEDSLATNRPIATPPDWLVFGQPSFAQQLHQFGINEQRTDACLPQPELATP